MSETGRIIIPDRLHRAQMEIYRDPTRFRVVAAGRRFGKCLAKGTSVWMAHGEHKCIEDVRVGDMVLSLNHDSMRLEKRKVLAIASNGVRETLTVKTASLSLTSTPHHPHLVNGGYRRADEIKLGDFIGVVDETSTCQVGEGDIFWDVVTEVCESDPTPTYDLQIEGNENFVANGFITHNTHLLRAELRRAATTKNNSNVWYVAPTYGMAREIMWDAIKAAIPDEWVRKYNETLLKCHLINGSTITLKGADRPDTLRGVGLDFVGLDEYQDFRPFVWDQVLRPTLATTQGKALFLGTPKSFNAFYDLYQKGQRQRVRKRPEWKSWQFPTITSPFVPFAEIDQARRDLDPRTFKQEFLAAFEAMSGRVYYPFEREKHVGDLPFNPKLPIWVGQDFNINPMSAAIMQPQPNGEVWVIDEIVLFNSNVTEVCDVLEQKYWRYQDQITIFPDPAGGSRQHGRGESSLDIFRERGFTRILNRKKHPFVQDRVNAVNSMLFSTDGSVRLRVDRSCRNVIEGFEQVIYKENSTEVDKSLNKEHVLDGLGYCIEYNFPTRKVVVLGVNI